MQGLDLDPELVAAFNERAAAAGLPAEATAGDAREFDLGEEFAMVLAPMQFVQVLGGASERLACLRCARRHLAPGGRLAVAIVDGMPAELVEEAPPPLPDTREVDGWVYSSLPLDAGLDARHDRRPPPAPDRLPHRQPRATSSTRSRCGCSRSRRSRPRRSRPASRSRGRREIPPTDSHVGSVVALLEAA